MRSGSPAQIDLGRALRLLAEAGSIISNAHLNPTHKGVQELGHGLTSAQRALSEMLSAVPANAVAAPADRSMDPMKVALRVLTCLADKTRPDSADLDALVRICGRKPDGIGWDELACETLQKVLADRAMARQALVTGAKSPRS